MANPGDQFPPGPDFLVRQQRKLQRQIDENASARSLEASQIGAGGLLVNDGGSITIEGTGALHVGSGSLDSAGSIAAATNVTAGGNVIAGGSVTGHSMAATAGDVTASGNVGAGGQVSAASLAISGTATVSGDIDLSGDLYTPHGLATPVTSGYFAAYINGDGRLGRTVSARRYKQDITAWSPEKQAIFGLQLVTYRLKSNVLSMGDDAPVEVGLIAEELVELGLVWLVLYIDGEVEGIAYEKISLALLPVVQDHEERLAEQETAMAALAERITALESR